MADINKFTSKEVLNKVLLDSSGNSVAAFSHTTQEALNAALDTTNNRLNMSLAGGTISGDVTINGDLTVTGTLSGLTSITGANIGIQSAGTHIGIAQTINFIGAGNTVVTNGNTIDVSISGSGGGGGLGTAINYSDATASPFSYIEPEATVNEDMLLDDTSAGEGDSYIVSIIPQINIASGIAVTVGAGKTMIIDVLQIGDL